MESLMLFKDINWKSFGIVVAIMAGIAIFFAVLIIIISRLCEVKGDPRVPEIVSHLSGANCGGCGHPGCEGFARALVEGKASLDDCGQTTKANKIEISNILGINYSGGEETVAVVACCGGIACDDKYSYQGYGSCISQQLLADGRKKCEVGCMGAGSCVDVCPNFAIQVHKGVAAVDKDLCISCGLCIRTCPKNLIKRIPKSAKVYIACSSQNRGKDVMDVCKAGCISCGLCQKVCPHDAIHLVNNVPIIDYGKCTGCMTCLEKCPRKCIRKC